MPDTGAPWNIPYVEAADLVSDWPADSLALANAIDAGLDAALLPGIGSNVVQTVKADTFSTNSATFQDLMSVSFTPSTNTSKVLLIASVPFGRSVAAHALQILVRRDSTNLIVPTSPSNRTGSPIQAEGYSGIAPDMIVFHFTFLDSPATTSAISYNLQARSNTGSGTVYVNRTAQDTDTAAFSRGVATLTAIEVAA